MADYKKLIRAYLKLLSSEAREFRETENNILDIIDKKILLDQELQLKQLRKYKELNPSINHISLDSVVELILHNKISSIEPNKQKTLLEVKND